MHRLTFFILIASLFHGYPAAAGPWLREKGTSFTSFTLSTSWFNDARSSGYMEFGITPTSTVGLDMGLSRNENGKKLAYGTIFLRRAIGSSKGPSKWAYEVGIGATYRGRPEPARPHIKTGLSWGRGFQLKGKSGWMAVDTSALWDLEDSLHVGKVDTTLGLNFNDRFTGIMQLNLAHQEGESFSYFEPSFVISPRKADIKLQIGLITPMDEPERSALKLGLWHEF